MSLRALRERLTPEAMTPMTPDSKQSVINKNFHNQIFDTGDTNDTAKQRGEYFSSCERELDEALVSAADGLPITARELYDSLAPEVLAQFYTGEIAERDLRTFAQELYEGREREAGRIPDSYDCVAVCQQCGPVWLTIPGHVPSCPWCINRYNGWPIPRPKPVTCATCRHFRRRNHAHLGDCGAGVKPYGAAGFWDTDPHACNRWLPSTKESGRN